VQLLVWVGNALGRGVYWTTEGDKQFTNLFAVLVGDSAKSRKGTSAGRIRQLMQTAAPAWVKDCIKKGLSSGEGVIWAIRDEVTKIDNKGEEVVVVDGVDDKRLLLDEREFFQALAVMKREGNTVSGVVRDGWDGMPLSSLTKNSPGCCAEPHLSISAHITEHELRSSLDHTSISNGFANRFLFVCVKRAQFLPFGGNLEQSAINALGKEIEAVCKEFGPRAPEVVDFVNLNAEVAPLREITMDAEAHDLWENVYRSLSEARPGMLGSIVARADPQTLRLAVLYAVLDLSDQIKLVHLKAALALWKYCEDSARYIFGDSLGDPLADELLRALRNSGEMSRTQIRDLFKRNQSHDKIDTALDLLARYGRARCEMRVKAGARGGPKQEVWLASGS
jgi:hypothetical protein